MKPVQADFRPAAQPGRRTAAWLAVLVGTALAATVAAQWQRLQAEGLRRQVAELEDERRTGLRPPAPRPPAIYAASAEAMLAERAAAWAPMLRSLENAAVIGVTPTLVEFNAADGTAHAELAYSDSAALFDYLARLDEGLPASESVGRWSLVQLRVQPAAAPTAAAGMTPFANPAAAATGAATASIQSSWIARR